MITDLRKALEEAVQAALQQQLDHADRSLVLRGKGEGFREVIQWLDEVERVQDSPAEEAENEEQ